MGFLGDLLGDILDGDGAGAFGQRIRSNDHALRDLYERTYFDFGLMPAHKLKENQFVPMTVAAWGGKVQRFEIRGQHLNVMEFLSRGWGSPFHTINREFPAARGRVWAFDTTRLHEGILSGNIVFPTDESYVRSEEYLKILRIIGSSPIGVLHSVPNVQLGFGEIWEKYQIPDSISISMQATYPFTDHQLQRIVELILHSYNRSDAPPVTADWNISTVDGTITLRNRNSSGNAQQSQSETKPQEEPRKNEVPTDDFPYDFYRGLGLIDSEDMVEVPSFLGSVRIHMTQDEAKNHLLAYKP